MTRTSLYTILGIIVVGGAVIAFFSRSTTGEVVSFEDCVSTGYPVMESHPRQCRTPDGRMYVEILPILPTYTNASEDVIVVDTPAPGATIEKEFAVIGKARGTWFFEASFPIELRDNDGNVLSVAVAQAEGEWMTKEFVPFRATLSAPKSYAGLATLVFKKDNPSGLPLHDAEMLFPVTIK